MHTSLASTVATWFLLCPEAVPATDPARQQRGHGLERPYQGMTVCQQKDAMQTSRQKVSWRDRYVRSEAARRSCEAHYRAVLENSTYGICHCNKQGEVVDANRALLIMLGYKSIRELLAANLSTDMLKTSQQRARLLTARDKRQRIPFLESEWFRKDGTPIKVRVSGRAVGL
jgi:PAS domain S-box-containing protein